MKVKVVDFYALNKTPLAVCDENVLEKIFWSKFWDIKSLGSDFFKLNSQNDFDMNGNNFFITILFF